MAFVKVRVVSTLVRTMKEDSNLQFCYPSPIVKRRQKKSIEISVLEHSPRNLVRPIPVDFSNFHDA